MLVFKNVLDLEVFACKYRSQDRRLWRAAAGSIALLCCVSSSAVWRER